MRFELSVALKYLIPKRRQLSVSIISLVSILVISLVVWLVLVFLSVTDGIEKKWIEELVALNAPLRMTPKEAYYRSYYYKIDEISSLSSYSPKTIGEKLTASTTNPYDPQLDAEIPSDFPVPDLHQDGSLKDIVKEGWRAIEQTEGFTTLNPKEYEVVFGNIKVHFAKNANPPLLPQDLKETVLNQASYIASFDETNKRLGSMLLPFSGEDYSNLLLNLEKSREEFPSTFTARVTPFFTHLNIHSLETTQEGWEIPKSLYPENAHFAAIGLVHEGTIAKIYLAAQTEALPSLSKTLSSYGYELVTGKLDFIDKALFFKSQDDKVYNLSSNPTLILEGGAKFTADFQQDSLQFAKKLSDLKFAISGTIQDFPLQATVPYKGLQIKEALPKNDSSSYWIHQNAHGYTIPSQNSLGDGIVLPKSYKESGAHLGDCGTIAFHGESTSSFQEMYLPVYIAGFYDPGLMPAGSRVVLADPKVTASLRSNFSFSDGILGNGISIWLPQIKDAPQAKIALEETLKKLHLDPYWKVESFADYELTQPIFQQLQSDKTLFTLIAVIILVVACSNIISMLILLVNDKRKEVGVLQSMGASRLRIGLVFGICGLITGLLSSIIGTFTAILTLKNLNGLISFLNFLQGHDAFHEAFYGSELPSSLSLYALTFVLIATILISILAGIIPAIKAARIQPSQILRAE